MSVPVAAQAHDVADPAAVVEVAVDGVGEVGAGDEIAERVAELRPVGALDRRVERTLLGEADEPRHRGGHTLNRLAAARYFFDVDTGREIGCRHGASSFPMMWTA